MVLVSSNRDLVIWGTNLKSLVGCGRLTKQISNIIVLAPYQKNVIIGLLLSDGWLTIASKTTKNARLGFKQSLSHSTYFWFVFLSLSHYCSSYPHLITGVRKGNRNYGLQFFTRSLPCMTLLHYLFYVNNVKVIPYNIYDLLTPVALAHWIMGDGTNEHGFGIILCTDSYSLQDILRLMNVLMIRYRLNCTLRKGHTPTNYRIYIKKSSMPLLISVVTPYYHNSMLYKLRLT
jgi:hypothetical protein